MRCRWESPLALNRVICVHDSEGCGEWNVNILSLICLSMTATEAEDSGPKDPAAEIDRHEVDSAYI